jgi:hypothetical protein
MTTEPETRPGAESVKAMTDEIDAAFTELSRSVSGELARMASDSRRSVEEMVEGVIEDMARLAAERLLEDPLRGGLDGGGSRREGSRWLDILMRRTLRNG